MAGQLCVGVGFAEGWIDDEDDINDVSISSPRLRYAPPWPEPSPRECYWYSRLARVISAGLWMTKKLGRIEDYVVVDVLDPVDAWPESLDGKHFGVFTMKGSDWSRFYKIGRMIVVVDLIRVDEAAETAAREAIQETQGD